MIDVTKPPKKGKETQAVTNKKKKTYDTVRHEFPCPCHGIR